MSDNNNNNNNNNNKPSAFAGGRYMSDGMPSSFAGVGLDALKYLHEERGVLVHGHEPLDTDMTPSLEGEAWLMHHDYMQVHMWCASETSERISACRGAATWQIEGVTNLHLLPPTGALLSIGFAKVRGGTGGLARLVAICPETHPHGVSIAEAPGSPLPQQPYPLRRDGRGVMRPTPGADDTEYCAPGAPGGALGCPLPV